MKKFNIDAIVRKLDMHTIICLNDEITRNIEILSDMQIIDLKKQNFTIMNSFRDLVDSSVAISGISFKGYKWDADKQKECTYNVDVKLLYWTDAFHFRLLHRLKKNKTKINLFPNTGEKNIELFNDLKLFFQNNTEHDVCMIDTLDLLYKTLNNK